MIVIKTIAAVTVFGVLLSFVAGLLFVILISAFGCEYQDFWRGESYNGAGED